MRYVNLPAKLQQIFEINKDFGIIKSNLYEFSLRKNRKIAKSIKKA